MARDAPFSMDMDLKKSKLLFILLLSNRIIKKKKKKNMMPRLCYIAGTGFTCMKCYVFIHHYVISVFVIG